MASPTLTDLLQLLQHLLLRAIKYHVLGQVAMLAGRTAENILLIDDPAVFYSFAAAPTVLYRFVICSLFYRCLRNLLSKTLLRILFMRLVPRLHDL